MTCNKENCCSDSGVSKKRESGFYWVKHPESIDFTIAEFIGNDKWLIVGIQDWVHESFLEIDERRIERQPKEGCGCDDVAISRLIDLMIDSGLFTETNQLYDIKNGLKSVTSNDELSPEYLKKLHPELSWLDAHELFLYCIKHTIKHKICYGDGSIMYPKWIESQKK